jgi:DNA polymerase-3 subunit beta
MKVTIVKEDFLKIVSVLGQVVNQKPSLPILGSFLLVAKQGKLEITATNLNTTITFKLPVRVEKEGSTTVPARLLVSFCQAATNNQLVLESEKDSIEFKAGKAIAKLATIPPNEFPPVGEFETGESITLDKKLFSESISEISFCAAPEEGRPVLTGILLRTSKEGLGFVATDGFRLGKKEVATKGTFDAVVPARALVEGTRALSEQDDELVEFSLNKEKTQARIKTKKLVVTTRLLEGEYPNYVQIIPTEFPARLSTNTKDLSDAVKLASVLARDLGNVVKLSVGKNKISASAVTAQVGEAATEVPAKTEGETPTVAFNSRFLLDSLAAIKGDSVEVLLSGETSAAIIRAAGSSELVYVVMPVRAQR